MNFVDTSIYRLLEKITDFLLLNLLWFLMCLPIITIFPATAAMFGVVRQWVRNKDVGVFRIFFVHFKENFKQAFIIGLLWFLFTLIFYINYTITLQMTGIGKVVMISLLLFMFFLFVTTSTYLFPVMVHFFHEKWKKVMRNALFFSISQLVTTILCWIIFLLACLISYVVPITHVFIWSATAYVIYALCNKTFKKVV